MPRTTLDIDASVLQELRRRQTREGKTLGQLVSELLLAALDAKARPVQPFRWHSQSMGATIDIDDKEALWAVLDADEPWR